MSAKPALKLRPYKAFLTPSMHRRFTHAALASLALCYAEAAFMSQAGLIWRFLPFGMTGIRTLLLFLPVLGVFIIRLANHHIGTRTTTSGFETFYQLVTSPKSWVALAWYLYSAFFFGEVYIWSRGQSGNLGWVDQGGKYERPRLNENPILLRTLYGWLAVVQTVFHLYYDYDATPILEKEGKKTIAAGGQQPGSTAVARLRETGPRTLRWSFNVMIGATVSVIPLYYLFMRRAAWSWAYFVGRTFFGLNKDSPPSGLMHVAGLLWQAVTSSLLLVVLWETSNAVFTVYVSEPPLKKENPLTSEVKDNAGVVISKSEDPNGSLVTGLKSKKEIPKTFAFWELYIICTQFEARRKSLFTEVDRKTGSSTWTQVSAACLGEIEAVRERIKTSQAPVIGRATIAEAELQRKQHEHLIAVQQQNLGLPKIASEGVHQNANVFTQQKPDFSIGNLAKSIGQHPGAHRPLSPYAKKAIEWGYDNALTPEQKQQMSAQGINKTMSTYMLQFLRSWAGIPFRQPFARMAECVVFGIPHSNRVNIIHSIRSITALVLASLKEDDYGQAAKDVPKIIRTLTSTITEIKVFLAKLEPSWTDVEFNPRDPESRRVEDVDELAAELEKALESILLAFGEYASSLGLSKKEMREAKEVLSKGREMVQRVGRT